MEESCTFSACENARWDIRESDAAGGLEESTVGVGSRGAHIHTGTQWQSDKETSWILSVLTKWIVQILRSDWLSHVRSRGTVTDMRLHTTTSQCWNSSLLHHRYQQSFCCEWTNLRL
ncbi:hypothetical protein AOLI_G00190270 [Acnodon oligacanthus]